MVQVGDPRKRSKRKKKPGWGGTYNIIGQDFTKQEKTTERKCGGIEKTHKKPKYFNEKKTKEAGRERGNQRGGLNCKKTLKERVSKQTGSLAGGNPWR